MLSLPLLVAGLTLPGAARAEPGALVVPVLVDLHPVGFNYGVRFDELFSEDVTGPRSSYLFREPMASASAFWRGTELGGSPLPPGNEEVERWRDAALAGASLAAGSLLLEAVDRSEAVSRIFAVARAAFAPSFSLEGRKEGWKARVNREPLGARTHVAMVDDTLGLARDIPRKKDLALGAGPVFASLLPDDDAPVPPESEPDADVALWLRTQHLLADSFNVSGHLLEQTWQATLREGLYRGVTGGLAVASLPREPLPKSFTASLTIPLPADLWSVQLRWSRDIPWPDANDLAWSANATLRWFPGSRSLTASGSWPLGQRVDEPGPVFPDHSAGTPILLLDPVPPAGSVVAPLP
jgi:hypothetical protein